MKIKQALLGVTLATAAAFVFADELPANANALQAPEIKCYGVNTCKGKIGNLNSQLDSILKSTTEDVETVNS